MNKELEHYKHLHLESSITFMVLIIVSCILFALGILLTVESKVNGGNGIIIIAFILSLISAYAGTRASSYSNKIKKITDIHNY